MFPPSDHSRVVTRPMQAYPEQAARSREPKEAVKTLRELSKREAGLATELYLELKNKKHNTNTDLACHCAVKRSPQSDTLVGFKWPGKNPVIIQVHDKSNKYIGRGAFGYVYESSQLVIKHGRSWIVPEGDQYKRVMKIQEESDDAQTEVSFQLQQQGTLGAGIINGVRYLDQLRLPGETLKSFFQRPDWPLGEKFECAVAILECAQNYVVGDKLHPDLKPDNMIYDPAKKQAGFIDNAHVRDVHAPADIRPEGPRGTPWFIAPEQYSGMHMSQKSMVFSLGIILLNLFSNTPDHYEAARSRAVDGLQPELHPEKVLSGLAQTNEGFVRQFVSFLLEMVANDKELRPQMSVCLAQMTAFQSAFQVISTSENKIMQQNEQVNHLQKQLSLLKKKNAAMKLDHKSQEEIRRLTAEGDNKQRLLQETLLQQEQTLNDMKEAQKKELDGMMKEQNKALDKEKQRNRELQQQAVLLERRARNAESCQKHLSEKLQTMTVEVEQLTDEAKRMELNLDSHCRTVDELKGVVSEVENRKLEVEQARVKAEEKITKYELALECERNDHKKSMDRLREAVAQKKKLESEKVSEAEKVHELSCRLYENLYAPLASLKILASNRADVDKAEFAKKLPGILEAQQSYFVKIIYLNDLAKSIFCNETIDGAVKPYTHHSSFRPFSLYSRRQQVDFTDTQRMHLEAVVSEAKVLVEKMLNGNEECKRKVCQFLQEGFAARVQFTDVFTKDNGWVEPLMAATPGIAKYRFTPKQVAEFSQSRLCKEFNDGREGDPAKSKQLTGFMTSLEGMNETDAAKSLLKMLPGKAPVDKLVALEHEFLSILTRPNAYTRGEQGTAAWLAESMWEIVAGEKYIREDIDSPSATKMRHIALLRSGYAEALTSLKDRELTSPEVEVLSNSRLVRFSPAQYQHELQNFQNELLYTVTTLLESRQNFETYKDYLCQKYSAKFATV
ncbi:hypothetical protein [Endozoicomonas sp. SCSIO W0465]|uniref:protein kinase domain-containing protein n=1 Tax=Endozoicomonas sp. SCSIO W0465 TaxID=2918516 RepID=UPI0020754E3C|nr:hypothetical protein [Endozoicomonas sp. SCSIO W0465]USE37389.1 hypothetical protein MJO57_03940 [Endozoicomonas sp. SCSIO W0465]